MPGAQSLNSADYSVPQSKLQPQPTTIAAAATVTPTGLVTHISGATAIVNVTPPQEGVHILIFVSTGTWAMTAAGNILTAVAATAAGVTVILVYDPRTGKYAAGKLAL